MINRRSEEERATEAVRSSGYRMTKQRSILLELIESATGHLDAVELHLLARQHDDRISLSTVYRTLSMLKKLDLVDELRLSEDHRHYESKSNAEHYHLVCLKCGKVIEFRSPLAERMQRAVCKRDGFVATSTRIDISGYCRSCQQAGATGESPLEPDVMTNEPESGGAK